MCTYSQHCSSAQTTNSLFLIHYFYKGEIASFGNMTVWWVGLVPLPDTHPATLSLLLKTTGEWDENSCIKIRTLRSLTNDRQGQNRLDWGEINLLPIKDWVQWWETKIKTKIPSLYLLLFPRLNFTPFSTPLPPTSHSLSITGAWGIQAVHISSSLPLLSPHTSPVPEWVLLWVVVLRDKPGLPWALHRPQIFHGLQRSIHPCTWKHFLPCLFLIWCL